MTKKPIKKIAYLLLLSLIASAVPAAGARAGENDTAEKETLSSMKKIAENEALELYYDETETDVAVRVKETGDLWFSNPVNAEDDTVASSYQQRQLKSQLSVRFFNENVQEATMDNYSDCIREGNFETEITGDGVTVTYVLGEAAKKYLLPEVISIERLDAFAAKLESSQSKKLIRNYTKYEPEKLKESEKKDLIAQYPGLESHGIYVLKTGAKEYIKEELAGYLKDIGYSQEDFDFDLEDNGFEADNKKPWFRIPLEYRLDGDHLKVTVDPAKISYNEEGYYPVEIVLLPYFGAAPKGSEGYIFVPDGSGALIDHDKKADSAYTAQVYGQDITMNVLSQTRSQTDQSLTVKIPVFGLKTGDKAYYAVIDTGAAYASLTASTSGRINSYNNVYASFKYLEYGQSSLGSMVGTNSFQMYSSDRFKEKDETAGAYSRYSVDYFFLHGDKADYSGMAEGYRQRYIEPEAGAFMQGSEDSIPFYAEYIGAIDKEATFLGIKHRAVTPVTTYAQALDITDRLSQAGIDNIKVIMSGWANKGLHGMAYTKITPVSKLNKGGVNRKKFINDLAAKGINAYFAAEFQRVYRDGVFDGYSALGSAPRYFDRSTVRESTYYLSNNMVDSNDAISLLKPSLSAKVGEKIADSLSGYANAGVLLGSISYQLYTDQLSEKYTDREDARNIARTTVSALSERFEGKVLADNANAYIMTVSSDIINAPGDSNRSLIISRTVPFYEMVIHGYRDYALDCLNMTDDYETTLLKTVESGAGLYFKWIYADNSVLKETKFDSLYSVNYASWIDKAIEDYKEVNAVLGPLQGVAMVRHEFMGGSDKLVRITYENGTKVIVNYSDSEQTVDGLKVGAASYGVIR